MKIERTVCRHKWLALDRVCSNSVVIFRSAFHQDIRPDDAFLTLKICGSYRDQSSSTRDKYAVVNLRTSKLSFVYGGRDVRIVDATVRIDD